MVKKSRRFDYFDAFQHQADFACKEADFLMRTLREFDPDKLFTKLSEAHVIEHEADLINLNIYTNLAQEFVAPLEREDISELGLRLDNVIDYIEEVVQALYMFAVKKIPDRAIEMADIICQECCALRESLVDFPTFKHSTDTLGHVHEVYALEEKGDELFARAIRGIFTAHDDPFAVMAWQSVYTKLEDCCDAVEEAAETVQTIIVKNS